MRPQPPALYPTLLVLLWLEERRLGALPCIAYRADGNICGAPATQIDYQRCGMVCAHHAPQEDTRRD